MRSSFTCIAVFLLVVSNVSAGYDYLALVQQWPGTECSDCKLNYFTLHGLWPTNFDGSYPSYCTNQEFDPNAISSIEQELDKFWPSFRGSNEGFWSHEYTKHGTCCEDVMQTELDFFSTSLKLRAAHDVMEALTQQKIYPSSYKKYARNDILDAIGAMTKTDVAIGCNGSDLDSVTICIDPNLNAVDCPSSAYGHCPDQVAFPNSTSGSAGTLRGATA